MSATSLKSPSQEVAEIGFKFGLTTSAPCCLLKIRIWVFHVRILASI